MISNHTMVFLLEFILLLMDVILVSDLRRLLLDFLVGQRNRKTMIRIHKNQHLKDRITLSYIKPLLKRYISNFQFYHIIYMIVIISFFPQNIIIIIIHIILKNKVRYVLYLLLCVKAFALILIRLQYDSSRISKYAKKKGAHLNKRK